MPEPEPNPFAEGCPVIIAYNPHHEAGTGVLGRVVKFEAGTGFMGCDLAHVEYTLPLDGTTHVLPFGTANLEPGNAERLIALAEKHEAEAARLRGVGGTRVIDGEVEPGAARRAVAALPSRRVAALGTGKKNRESERVRAGDVFELGRFARGRFGERWSTSTVGHRDSWRPDFRILRGPGVATCRSGIPTATGFREASPIPKLPRRRPTSQKL